MKYECDIVKDLMPLYVDDVLSENSKTFRIGFSCRVYANCVYRFLKDFYRKLFRNRYISLHTTMF